MNTCRNCAAEFETKYCPECGTSAQIKRIDRHYVVHELQHGILHFEKGFLFTVKELLTKPGHSIRKFIEGDRAKHYKPIGFLIICSIIYSFVSHYIGKYNTVVTVDKGYVDKLSQWVIDHYNYSNIIEMFFLALTVKWFFRKKGYNYFENFVLLSYLTGLGMLIGVIFLVIDYLAKTDTLQTVYLPLTIVYTVWAIGQFFNERKWMVYLKALLAYLLGFFMFVLSVNLLGILLNVILKK